MEQASASSIFENLAATVTQRLKQRSHTDLSGLRLASSCAIFPGHEQNWESLRAQRKGKKMGIVTISI
jgi:hypothetical protein